MAFFSGLAAGPLSGAMGALMRHGGLALRPDGGADPGSFLSALRDRIERDRLRAAQAIVEPDPAEAMQIRARSEAIDALRAEAKERAGRQRTSDMTRREAGSPAATARFGDPEGFSAWDLSRADLAAELVAPVSHMVSATAGRAYGNEPAALGEAGKTLWAPDQGGFGSAPPVGDLRVPMGNGLARPAFHLAARQAGFPAYPRFPYGPDRDIRPDADQVGRDIVDAAVEQFPAPRPAPGAVGMGIDAVASQYSVGGRRQDTSVPPTPALSARTPPSGGGNSQAGSYARIGSLSEQYESQGPGTVSTGQGDRGGVSYGSWQLASRYGKPEDFLAAEGSHWASELNNLRSGTPEFTRRWQAIAAREPEAFQDAQRAYILRTHYQPTVSSVLRATGVDLNGHSQTLRDVAWSASVQHGTAPRVLARAVRRADGIVSRTDPGYEEALINSIYDERVALLHRLIRDPDITPAERANLRRIIAGRYVSERREALHRLRLETRLP